MARRREGDQHSHSIKIIKRYGNRKLYDTQQSRYVTLEEIYQMLRDGENFKVIDNKNKEDLTLVTLTQIMLEEQKNNKNVLPLSLLKNLLAESGESLTEWIQKNKESFSGPIMEMTPWIWPTEWVQKSKASFVTMKHEAEEQISRFIEKNQETKAERANSLKEWLINPQKHFDSIQKKIDERIKYFFSQFTGLDELEEQIKELEKYLARLEKKLSQYEKKNNP